MNGYDNPDRTFPPSAHNGRNDGSHERLRLCERAQIPGVAASDLRRTAVVTYVALSTERTAVDCDSLGQNGETEGMTNLHTQESVDDEHSGSRGW